MIFAFMKLLIRKRYFHFYYEFTFKHVFVIEILVFKIILSELCILNYYVIERCNYDIACINTCEQKLRLA